MEIILSMYNFLIFSAVSFLFFPKTLFTDMTVFHLISLSHTILLNTHKLFYFPFYAYYQHGRFKFTFLKF